MVYVARITLTTKYCYSNILMQTTGFQQLNCNLQCVAFAMGIIIICMLPHSVVRAPPTPPILTSIRACSVLCRRTPNLNGSNNYSSASKQCHIFT